MRPGHSARAFEDARCDHSKEKTADVRQIRHAAGSHIRDRAGVNHLDEEPEADEQCRRDPCDANKNEDDENRANPVARIGDDECTHNRGNGAAGAQRRNSRMWVSCDLNEHGHKTAGKVEDQVPDTAHCILNRGTKSPEVNHVADDMEPTAMQKHGSDKRDPVMAKDDAGGNGGPSVYKAIAAGQFLNENEYICQDDENCHGGQARGTPGRVAEGNQTSHFLFLRSMVLPPS